MLTSASHPADKWPKVVYLCGADWYFALHFIDLARGAKAAGYEVHIIAGVGERQSYAAQFDSEGFHFHPLVLARTGTSPSRDLLTIMQIVRLYRRLRPDIVHHIAIKPVLYGQLAAFLTAVPVRINALTGLGFVFSSSRLKARILRPLVSLALRLFLPLGRAQLVVLNDDDADDLAHIAKLPRAEIRVIPGTGVDLTRFVASDEPTETPVVVALVARMLVDKGVLDVIAAAEQLRHDKANVIIRLVGAPDAKNPASLPEQQLRDWHADGLIDYIGHVSNVPAVWRDAHVALLPSYREGLGMSLIEAAACARPLIATDVPGCRQAVIDGVTGILVPATDSDAIVAAIKSLVSDPQRRRTMGAAARKDAEQRFSKVAVVAQVIDLYSDKRAAH